MKPFWLKHMTAALLAVSASTSTCLEAQPRRTLLNHITVVRSGAANTSANYQNEARDEHDQMINVEARCWARIPYPPSHRDVLELEGLPSSSSTLPFYASSTCLRNAGARIVEYPNSAEHRCVVSFIRVEAMKSCFKQ